MLPLKLIVAITGLTGFAAAGPVAGHGNAVKMRDNGFASVPGLLEKRCTDKNCTVRALNVRLKPTIECLFHIASTEELDSLLRRRESRLSRDLLTLFHFGYELTPMLSNVRVLVRVAVYIMLRHVFLDLFSTAGEKVLSWSHEELHWRRNTVCCLQLSTEARRLLAPRLAAWSSRGGGVARPRTDTPTVGRSPADLFKNCIEVDAAALFGTNMQRSTLSLKNTESLSQRSFVNVVFCPALAFDMRLLLTGKHGKAYAPLSFLRDLKIYVVEKPYHLAPTKDRKSDSVITDLAHDVYDYVEMPKSDLASLETRDQEASETQSFPKAFLGAKGVQLMHYKQRVKLHWPLETEELQAQRIQILNVDSEDMVLADQMSPGYQGENTLLYFNQKQRFYYVSEQH
ncbi:hypothetical protein PG985_011828 [Apiospora marii]|uniref:uncharacterized protein n=1 Tax=Apiospora marii TaxID=335849 RepID=UPI0031306983